MTPREVCDKCGQALPIPFHAHEVEAIPGDYYQNEPWRSSGAICKVCGTDLGWYCPNSPDHRCHYSRSFDSCDFCHNPEERM